MPAQLREDEILWAGLSDVRGEDGRYLDIGASDPVNDSVTEFFYARGWFGVNVEPRIEAVEALERMRPRDRTLRGVCSDREEDLLFYMIGFPRSNAEQRFRVDSISSLDPRCAIAALRSDRNVSCELVHSYTLDFLFAENFLNADVHFLKIDVEGAEAPVLRGWDKARFRPWLLCIEANTDELGAEWHPDVEAAGYSFLGQHVVNRFFVANERSERGDRVADAIKRING
jgi:FkbM family methyltransferase